MTNEEILANAPKDGAATHILVDHEHHVTYAKRYPDSGNWFWFHPDSGWLEFDRMPTAQNIQSLSDIRRIVELEKEVERLNAHNQIFDAATALNDNLKQKLEAAERERDDYKRIAVDAATESFLIAADNEIKRALAQENKSASAINHCQHQFHCAARSCAIDCVNNQLRQQLNGGE